MISYGKYFVCETTHLLEYLQQMGFEPVETFPVKGFKDKWEYIFENTPDLEEAANSYYRQKLWRRRKDLLKNGVQELEQTE